MTHHVFTRQALDGDETLVFTLYERGKIEPRPATKDERRWEPKRLTVRATVPAGDLVLKIRKSLSIQTEFKELKTPLEGQLPAVIAQYRGGAAGLGRAPPGPSATEGAVGGRRGRAAPQGGLWSGRQGAG